VAAGKGLATGVFRPNTVTSLQGESETGRIPNHDAGGQQINPRRPVDNGIQIEIGE
jgi:hypothetical protein